ncbi:signal recognition particle protein [bacterium]|nr:signal recognition particle protein [bacterium]
MFDFLSQSFSSIFSQLTGQSKLTQANLQQSAEQVEQALVQADVPYEVVTDFIQKVFAETNHKKILGSLRPAEMFVTAVYDAMIAFLGGAYEQESFTFQIPSTIVIMGLQGSGKTTTLAKLAYFIKKEAQKRGKKRYILCASLDYYRPAAIDQLEILAKQVDIEFYRAKATHPIQAAHEIMDYAKQKGFDQVFVDTAGRLHVDQDMMLELEQIVKIVKPKYSFLVLDAMTGQESLKVAQSFENAVGFGYGILSKMDSNTKAGAAFAFRYVLKKPILFMGTGEKPEDLELFRPERIAKRMLGMGDIATLLENAQEKIAQQDQDKMASVLSSGKITLEDFAQQLSMMNKFGSLSSVIKYLPGMSKVSISQEQLERGDKELKRFKAIISSMTRKERLVPQILDGSRKQRVAKGAGVSVQDVNILLERFEQSKHFVKLFKKNKLF